MESDNWGLIGSYDPEYAYEFKETEYVEFGGKVWIPTMLPTADTLKEATISVTMTHVTPILKSTW